MAYKVSGTLIVSTSYLCKLFGVSSDAIGAWRKERGLDCAYVSRGKWNLKDAVVWWAENIHYPRSSSEIANSRERWELARADKLEFELERMKSLYMPKDQVVRELQEYLSTVVAYFYLLPKSAPAFLEGMVSDMPGVIRALEIAVKEICDALAERSTLEQIEKKLPKV